MTKPTSDEKGWISIGVQKVNGVWCTVFIGPSGPQYWRGKRGTKKEAMQLADKLTQMVSSKLGGCTSCDVTPHRAPPSFPP